MPEFAQHPDGLIYIRGSVVEYVDSRENFEADFGVKLTPLPNGADEHIYTQGVRHCFMGSGNVIEGGPMPWPDGDAIIAGVQAGIDAKKARPLPEPPPIDMRVTSISDRQFFQQLAVEGIISQADALSAVRVGTIPAPLQALIDQLPAGDQFGAIMIVSGGTTFERSHPLTVSIGHGFGWNDGQMDDFFTAAAAL